jgi:hypothetical protein
VMSKGTHSICGATAEWGHPLPAQPQIISSRNLTHLRVVPGPIRFHHEELVI